LKRKACYHVNVKKIKRIIDWKVVLLSKKEKRKKKDRKEWQIVESCTTTSRQLIRGVATRQLKIKESGVNK
jgi:hypothetical protein